MANTVVNKIILEGDFNEIQSLVERYTNTQPESFYRNEEGLIVFCKYMNNDVSGNNNCTIFRNRECTKNGNNSAHFSFIQK